MNTYPLVHGRGLLRLLAGAGGEGSLASLFPGRFVPVWAADAVEWLEPCGYVERVRLGVGRWVYRLTDRGRAAAAGGSLTTGEEPPAAAMPVGAAKAKGPRHYKVGRAKRKRSQHGGAGDGGGEAA